MKKACSKIAPKSARTAPKPFVDELTEAQQLRTRLHDIVHELKETVRMLEQNLERARRSAEPRRAARDGSPRNTDPAATPNNRRDKKPGYFAGGEDIAPSNPVRRAKRSKQ